MASSQTQERDAQEKGGSNYECDNVFRSLPKEEGWKIIDLYQYQQFWYPDRYLTGVISSQKHFQARDTDLFVITTPKAGTTWLKSLTFSIVNRSNYTPSTHPLLTKNSHALVPFLEIRLYANNQIPDLSTLQSPRIFGTHISCGSLPESIKDLNCRIVYLCRNTKDTFVSLWHFYNKCGGGSQNKIEIGDAFELYCKGVSAFGPFWEHVLGYWKLSLERPNNVLFLKYEDLIEDTSSQLKKLAEFLGYPFSSEEVEKGAVDEIIRLCSFESLSNLEVNKTGKLNPKIDITNNVFFRKAKVGDWENHLTQEMVERLDHITQEKLNGSGLEL
ncbi:hypothetical protein IFM89_012565 [Coptis chinensis]|uniref:Sulfotransferase n=1 Tax=Coptis chinensis TaxID=261450 RepID=A0A835LLX6_9MAGN|nr:hypothetical protein IFM89_012565 [Coptis chinensis]